jgi:hypothetical protein
VRVVAGDAQKMPDIVRSDRNSPATIELALSIPWAKTARAPARRNPALKLSTRSMAVDLVGLALPHSEFPDA